MENYHHMHSQLARLKVAALDNMKKESKLRYNEALRSYVIKYFGRPLDKLNVRIIFFTLLLRQLIFFPAILRRSSDQSPTRDQGI